MNSRAVTRTRRHRLLTVLVALPLALSGWLVAQPATAAPQPAPFTDDTFTLVDTQTDNIGPYTSTDGAFAADPTVLTRGSADPGHVTWATDFDVTSVVLDSYIWVHGTNQQIRIATSADGTNWTYLSNVRVTQRPNSAGADWPYTVHEAVVTAPGQRHVRVDLLGSADGGGWGIQVAKAYVNSRALAVTADPAAPSRIDGPTDISLTTATPGAEIFYTVDGGTEQRYTAPISIDGKASITAVARATGLVDSAPATFNYSSAADIIVDRYGQMADVDFPGKVTRDAELQADVAADDAYYAAQNPPERDQWGGDPGSRERLGLDGTGWFTVQTTNDGRKTLVDPDGNQFFSLGANVFGSAGDTYTQVAGREELYEYLPTTDDDPLAAGWMGGQAGQNYSFYVANQVRKYGEWDPNAYWARQVDRAKSWCFNTAGGFSSVANRSAAPFPYVAHVDSNLPSHEIGWSGLYDVFAPGLQAELNAAMATNVASYKDDPYLIGYMFFNEIQWTRLRTAVSQAKASEVASKGVLVDLLEERHGTVASFNQAWGLDVESFDELREQEFTPRTDAAVADIDAFSALFMDKFYEVFSTAIRNADPNHLVIGDRWFGNVIANDKLRDQLATAAGKHLDLITYNYYTWDLNPERIDAIYEASGGTPMILTEFHYGDPTHGLTFAIRMGADATDKGLLYRNYVEKAASSGKIVGTHWFEWVDQAPTGRWFQGYDGEAGGIGFLDVTDRPYKETMTSVTAANCGVYELAEGEREPYQYAFTPAQTERDNDKTTHFPKATEPLTVDGVLDANWPEGETLTLGTTDLTDGVALDGVEGRFRFAWDDQYLYLHASIDDETPMLNPNQGFDIWNGDGVELFFGPRNVDQGGGIQVSDTQIILNAQPQDDTGRITYFWYNERTDQPEITGVVKPADGGYTLEARIALADLGLSEVTPPQTVRFDVGFDDGNGRQRQRQYMWNGVEGNSQNREAWGRAVFDGVATSPSPSPTPTPTVTLRPSGTDHYSVPGFHYVGGRHWWTTCEPYSKTVRCRTEIWATQAVLEGGRYRQKTGWFFNNLTYLPLMTRAQWGTSPLANPGTWTTSDGRQWRTECDTPATGRNNCRTWAIASYVVAKQNPVTKAWSYSHTKGWVLNNIVRFAVN